jgi:hypothetical protein
MAVTVERRKQERRRFASGPKSADLILPFIEILLLAIWLGLMVTNAISKVELLGIVIGPVLTVLLIATRAPGEKIYSATAIRAVLLLTMTATAAISRYFVTPAMVTLRNNMPDIIDNVPPTDPMKIQFDSLHQYSVGLMSVALFAGLAALFLTVRSLIKR